MLKHVNSLYVQHLFSKYCIKSQTVRICTYQIDDRFDLLNMFVQKKKPTTFSDPEYIQSKVGGKTIATMLIRKKDLQIGTFIEKIFEKIRVPIMFQQVILDDEILPLDHRDYDSEECNESLASIKRNGVGLNLDVHCDKTSEKRHALLANMLNLHSTVINISTFVRETNLYKNDIDILFVCENNFNYFSNQEYKLANGVVQMVRTTNCDYFERFIYYTFKCATKSCRKKITFGHKLTELPLTECFFIKIARKIQPLFPNIQYEEMDVGSIAENLVKNPNVFDVICLSQKFGTLIMSIACGVCGGNPMYTVCDYGQHYAVFHPLSSKLDPVNITDDCGESLCPFSSLLAAVHLIVHAGYTSHAKTLGKALLNLTFIDKKVPKTLGGTVSTEEFLCSVMNKI